MGKQYDVIVVGAGHNGLIVAAYMAKAGLKTLVLEKEKWVGGATSTAECTLPGFKHDLGGTMHSVLQGNPVIAKDELGLKRKYGLKYIFPEMSASNVFEDGTSITFWHSVDKTCEDIAKFSPEDAEAYKKFNEMAMPMFPLLGAGMFSAPPTFGQMIAQFDQNPIGRELTRFLMMSSWDVAKQWFKHPKVLSMALKISTEAMVGPEEKGCALHMLLGIPFHHIGHAGFPEGGSVQLPLSLVRCIEANGGEVLLDREVVTIKTKGGKAVGVVTRDGEEYAASRAVVANVDPRLSLLKWLDTPLSADIQGKLNRILDPLFSGLMQAIALNEAPKYNVESWSGANQAVVVEPLPSSVTDLREMFDELRYGRIPTKGYAPFVVVPTKADPTRAPAGKHVLYLWHYMPYFLENGGPAKWDEIKVEVADKVLNAFRRYAPNVTDDNILGRYILSPYDYPKWNANLVNGGVVGFGAYLSQSYAYRPIPELGQYRTPVKGLYLSGMSCHPGGAIIGGGRATAQIIFQDMDIDFDDVIDIA
jgi:beta-carotene ketolase (CrtO type)